MSRRILLPRAGLAVGALTVALAACSTGPVTAGPTELVLFGPDATVELDLNVIDAGRSGLGWQRLSIALNSFERDDNDFRAVMQPMIGTNNTGDRRWAVAIGPVAATPDAPAAVTRLRLNP